MPTVWASAGSGSSAGAVTAIIAAANQPKSLRRDTGSDIRTSKGDCEPKRRGMTFRLLDLSQRRELTN
jgi:hypothetical protein